jgi:hypothetical protein
LLACAKRVIVVLRLPAPRLAPSRGHAIEQSVSKDRAMSSDLPQPDFDRSEPFLSLLYRYFFFDWLFRDVTRGTLLERAAAWRFNRESRHHLLVYLRRWTFVFVAGYALGVLFEHAFELAYAAACCYSSSCVSASVIFIILLSWFTLK